MNRVCVHGLGYIGLPTAAMLANYDRSVFGYDTDPAVIGGLQQGNIHFDEPGLDAFVRRAFDHGTLTVRDEIVAADYHLICVPTPFDEAERTADLSYVRDAARSIQPHLREGDTVVLESTVPPGTTREIIKPELEASGLTVGTDIGLAHCPETVLPGNVITELRENNRVIGGVTPTCAQRAAELYDCFVTGDIHTVRSTSAAEFIKLIQNTYRDVNIALANELATIAADYGIDARDAFSHANLHPRVDLLEPGPGVGGHCLPIDPWFLAHGSERLDLIDAARRVNDGMAGYVIDQLRRELDTLDGHRIAILGIAYKRNVDDTRRSPGLRIAQHLLSRSADPAEPVATGPHGNQVAATDGASMMDGQDVATVQVSVCDPRVESVPGIDLRPLSDAVAGADAAILTVAHDEFQALLPDDLADRMDQRIIIDTRGILDVPEWTNAGFTVRRI